MPIVYPQTSGIFIPDGKGGLIEGKIPINAELARLLLYSQLS